MKLQWPLSFKNSISRVQLNSLFEFFGYTSNGGIAVTEKNAVEVTAVFCAVRVLAEGIAQMPMRIKKRETRGKHEFLEDQKDHWAWQLMAVRPNSWMTSFEFREYAIGMAALFGDFVAIKNGPTQGTKITELLPLVPGSWKVEQDAKFNLIYDIKVQGGASLKLKRDDVMHLRGPSINGFSGMQTINIARNAVALAMSLEKSQSQLAQNGGRPSGVLSSENKIKPEKAELIKKAWTDKFGAGGDGGVAVLDGGWKFQTMQMSSVDAQHIETRKFQIEEIARAFRVSPQMLMSSDKTATFASAESFFRNHVIHTLGPWAERYEEVINRDILGGETDIFSDLDERNLLRGDFKDRDDGFAKALGAGGTPAWMTQNEVRAELGLIPIIDQEADTLFNGFQQPKPNEEEPDA